MDHPDLEPLRRRLEEEERRVRGGPRGARPRLAALSRPWEASPPVAGELVQLNSLWPGPARPAASGLGGALRARAWDALTPVVERQERFNAALVRLLNAHLGRTADLHADLRELAAALVRYAQRVEPVMDARDRARVRDRPHRGAGAARGLRPPPRGPRRRLEGLLALRDRLEAVSEEVGGPRQPRRRAPPPERARPRRKPPTTPHTPPSRTASEAAGRRSAGASRATSRSSPGSAPGRRHRLRTRRVPRAPARGGDRGPRRRWQRPRRSRVPGEGARRRGGRPRRVPEGPGRGLARRGLRRTGRRAPAARGAGDPPRRRPPGAATGRPAGPRDRERGLGARASSRCSSATSRTSGRCTRRPCASWRRPPASREARIEMRSPVPSDVRLQLAAERGAAPAGDAGPERERRAPERAALRPARLRPRRPPLADLATGCSRRGHTRDALPARLACQRHDARADREGEPRPHERGLDEKARRTAHSSGAAGTPRRSPRARGARSSVRRASSSGKSSELQ